MPELQILAAAAEEAEAAIRWYEYEQPELGKQLRATFDAALDQLEAGTLAGSSMPGPIGIQGVRRLVLRRFPYSLVFIPRDSTITILAFAHHSRRPSYWRSRGPRV